MHGAPKVLHIITRLDFGGSAINTITTVDRLRNHNFQTALAFGFTPRFAELTNDPDGSVREILASRRIPWFYLPHLVRDPSPLQDLSALNGIRRLLKNEKYDLVHTHTSKAGTLGRLAAHWRGIPVVHTPHGHIFYGYFGPAVTAFYVLVERWMAHYTARIISLTDNETRESLERGIGRPEQYATIPSGVPLSVFRDIPRNMGVIFRNSLQIPSDAFIFLSVGRLVPIKGFDILLKAFARADFSAGLSAEALGAKTEGGLPEPCSQAKRILQGEPGQGSACSPGRLVRHSPEREAPRDDGGSAPCFARALREGKSAKPGGGKGRKVCLLIVGDGEERHSLESLAGQLGITARVRWAGEMRDIRAALSAADAFVLASRNEGMGRIFIEAMAAGLPVIGAAVGGVPSVINDRHTGLLVAGEDPDALARALIEMAVNDDLRAALGKNAAGSISPEYDEDATVARIAALYREVL